jgi:preprotein translocase subunit YajC
LEGLSSLIFLAFLIAIFYFMLIRPQKKRVESHRQLISSVSVGDEVVTIGGAYGIVRRLGDDDVELEIAPGTTVRFVKSAIARRLNPEDEIGDTGDGAEDSGEEERA